MASSIAIYCRVSTGEQSTELQRQELERFVQARGWDEPSLYEDKASGTNANRPALKRLLSDARRRKIDVILCWKLDRLFRSLKDLITTLQEFQDLGITFISLKDNIDLTTASGRLLMQVIGAMAEFEASLIRERVRSGLQAAKSKGKILGRRPTIDGALVMKLRAQNKSLSQIGIALGVTKSGVSKTLKKLSLHSAHKSTG